MTLEKNTTGQLDEIISLLNDICNSLNVEGELDFQSTENLIAEYISRSDKVYYYPITEWCYSLTEENRLRVEINNDKLFDYIKNNCQDPKTTTFIEHFYDHLNLAMCQNKQFDQVQKNVEKFNEWSNQLAEKNSDLEKKISSYETRSITILGIFSAIVVSITGVLSFSENIFSSIDSVSTGRLFAVGGLVLIGFIALVHILTSFISRIHNQADSNSNKSCILIFVAVIAVISIIAIIFDCRLCNTVFLL